MRVPKKISPDNIKEAFVEVRYHTVHPYEIVPGVFYNAFDESYFYTEKPLKPHQIQKPALGPREIKILVGNQSFVYNQKITIQIIPNALIFSCFDKYVGWTDYRQEIEKALKIVANTEIINLWTRVGIRYISEYPEKDLREFLNFSYSFGHPDVKSRYVAFKSEFDYNKSKIILNLNNLRPIVIVDEKNPSREPIPTSLIDIDVIKENLTLKRQEGIGELLKLMEEAHLQEKEIFFGMLNERFLATLNPEY